MFAFLDCGIYDCGFARVVCNDCRAECLVAFLFRQARGRELWCEDRLLPTAHARQAHRLMVRRPSFAGGLLAAGAALLRPPLVFLAMALLDWAYIRAGQKVPLS